mmetsp:Transcript_19643/g.63924  ORF Transcript_19643/g.63924 Transcript_19643/m.63924 type:complete len:221 (-) Transcript_19643:252-914(-)
MLQLLQHNHAAAARDDETVARHVEGARGRLGAVIVLCGKRRHRVKHDREAPVLCLARAAEHHVGLVELDLLHADADAVGARRARRRDREGHALELEVRGENCRDCGAHGPCDSVRADPPQLAVVDRLHGLHHVGEGSATLPEDPADARVVDVLRRQARVLDAALHCDKGILCVDSHEAGLFPIDQVIQLDLRPTAHVRLHPNLLVLGVELDAGLGLLQRG